MLMWEAVIECILDSEKAVPANTPQPRGDEAPYKVDHFDGDVVQSEQSQPNDNKDRDNERSGDKERTVFRGKDVEKGHDHVPTPTYDRNPRSSAAASDERFERSGKADVADGLKDGERHRTRRKESGSWADEMEARPEADQKPFATFESETDGGQSSRRDDVRGTSQYSRQDRRKSQNLLIYC